MAARDTSTLCLFDVDGTLTAPRKVITEDFAEFIKKLQSKVVVGLVGGSDLVKIREQLATIGDVVQQFDYVFSENGLVAHKNGALLAEQSILKYMGEEKLQTFINFALKKLSELTLPCKRGTFIEFRTGMINVCPVGRTCTQSERDQFAQFDKENHVREKLVEEFKKEFPNAGLTFAIGGQISIDIFPDGWDKRYCLQYVEGDGYEKIHFFGDKTSLGGNDYAIYEDRRTIGHTVTNPEDTRKQLEELFF